MATKKITIPVGFQFDDVTGELANVKKSLSNIKINTNLGDSYAKAFNKAEKEIEKLQQRAARGFSSQSDIDAYSTGLNSVLDALERIQTLSGKIKFTDLNLNADQLKQFISLKNSLGSATQLLSNFKRSQINNLFQGNEQFATTMKDIVGLTEQTYKDQSSLTSKINESTKALQNQGEQYRKNLELAKAQVATFQGAQLDGDIESVAAQYGRKNKNGKWSFNANQGKVGSEGRTALLNYGQQTGFFSDEDVKKLNSADVSLQSIVNTYNEKHAALQQAIQDQQQYQDQLDQNKAKLEAVKTAQEALDAALNNGAMQKAQKDYDEANLALEQFKESTVAAAQAQAHSAAQMDVSAGTLKGYKAELISFRNQLDTMQSADNLFNSLTSSVKQLVGFGAVLTQVRRGIQLAVSQIQELDSAMNGISVVTNMSTAELWGQINTYMAIAKQYGVTTEGTYQVSQLYYQMGLDTSSVMELTTETLKMAKIANLDYASATDYMTTAMNGFKLSATDAGRIVDVYSELAGIAATDTSELAVAMSKTAAIANSAGMSFEATSAMLTQMIESTREAPEALGTSLKTVIARMQEMKSNPTQLVEVDGETASLNKMDTALASVGISLKDASGQFRNLDEVIFELSKIWDTLDRNTQRWIANTASGSRQQSRFISLLSDSERLQELYTAALDSEDAALVQYSKSLDSMESKLNQLSTAFQQFYMQIFNGETLKSAVEYLTQFVDKLNEVGPVGAIAIVGSLVNALGSIGIAMSTKIAAAYKVSKDFLDKRKTEIQAVGDSWWDGFVANFVPKVQAATTQAVQVLQNAQTKVQGKTNTPKITGIKHQTGQTRWKAKGGISSAGAPDQALKGAEKAASKIDLIAGAASKAAPVVSLLSTYLFSVADASNKASIALSAVGSVAQIGVGIAQLYSGDLIGLLTIFSGFNQIIGIIETASEKAARLAKNVEKSNISRAEAKSNLTNLDSAYKKYVRLRDAQYENNEAYEDWINYNQQLISQYPEIAYTYDEQGNKILSLAENYLTLKNNAEKAYEAAAKIYEQDLITQSQDSFFSLEKSGAFEGLSDKGREWMSSAYTLSRQNNIDIFSVLPGIISDNDLAQQYLGKVIRNAKASSNYNYIEELANQSLTALDIINNPELHNMVQAAKTLQKQGFSTSYIKAYDLRTQDIAYNANAALKNQALTNAESAVSEMVDSGKVSKEMQSILLNAVNSSIDAASNRKDFSGIYTDSLTVDKINGYVSTTYDSLINRYGKELLSSASDIAQIKGQYSAIDFSNLSEETKRILSEVFGITFEQYTEQLNNYIAQAKNFSGNLVFGEEGSSQYTAHLSYYTKLLADIPANLMAPIFDSLKQLDNLKLQTSDPNIGIRIASQAAQLYSELFSSEDFDYNQLSSLVQDVDLTTRSGWLKFLDSVKDLGDTGATLADKYYGLANSIPVTMADAEQGLASLQTSMASAADIIKNLQGSDSEKKLAAYNTLSALGIDAGRISTLALGEDLTGDITQEVYNKYIAQQKANLEAIIDSLYNDATPEQQTELDGIRAMIAAFDKEVAEAAGTRATNIVSLVLSQMEDVLGGKAPTLSRNDISALKTYAPNMVEMLEQTGNDTWTLKAGVTTRQWAEAISGLANSVEEPGMELIQALKDSSQEKWDKAVSDADLENFITPMLEAISDGGEITFNENIYKFLSEQLGKDVVDKMLDPNALTAFTGLYDFDGTVKEWLDMVQKIINKLFPDYNEEFSKWREKNEYGLNQSREYNRAQEKMDKVHKAEETPQAMADIALKMKNMEASTDDATEAVRRFNLEYTDLVQLANGKWGLSSSGLKKLELDAQIISVEDYRDEIAQLRKELETAGTEEAKNIKAVIALRQQELKLLNEKNQLVSQNADDYNTLLDAPENYAKNIISYADELKKAAKTGYIEISTLSNVINNLGPASNTVKALSKQLNVDLLEDGTANIVALTDALYSTKKLATIDGKPMVQIGSAMANMLQGAAKLDLKDVAQQNIDMLDGMISTLEALKALEETGEDIEPNIKIDMLTQATFTDVKTGKSFSSFNELWERFKQVAEQQPDLYIELTSHLTESITTEKGQKQVIDWIASDENLQQQMGVSSRVVPENVIIQINNIDVDDNGESRFKAQDAINRWLYGVNNIAQETANKNPINPDIKVEPTITTDTENSNDWLDRTIEAGNKAIAAIKEGATSKPTTATIEIEPETTKYDEFVASTQAPLIQNLEIQSNVEQVQKAVDELAKDRTSTLTITKYINEVSNSASSVQATSSVTQEKNEQENHDTLKEINSNASAIAEKIGEFVTKESVQPVTQPSSVQSTTSAPTVPTQSQASGRWIDNLQKPVKVEIEADAKPAQQVADAFYAENEGKDITYTIIADNKVAIANADEATRETESQEPVINISGDNSEALAATGEAVNVIDSSGGTVSIGGDASAVYDALNEVIAEINNENINVYINPIRRGGRGAKGGSQTYTAYASGGGVPKAGRALVGELGPEMVVRDNSYQVVGQYGAEFVNLKKNDVVFNATDTAKVLKGKAGARGTALVNGTGPAYASGLDSAIAALKEARAAWSSILNSVPDMLKKGSGGSGGGSDDTTKEYLMDLEKWFNWLRRIEELENKITVLRAKRENIKDGKVYADSLYEENAYLKKQSELYQGLINDQVEYRENLKNDYLKDYARYFYFVGDAIQINAQAILDDTKNNEELGEKIQDLIDDYKDVTEQITENTSKLEENKTQMDENIRTLRDKYIDMENEILSALKNMYQKEIDNKQKALDEMQKADQAYLDSLKKNLDKEKNLREKSKTQEEKQTLQRKIALLSRDTSGKNAKELADLRQQLRDMQEEQYFNDREDAITSAEDATQAQQNALQKEIDNLTEANQIKLDNIQLYWEEVQNIINQGNENILAFLQSYSDSYTEASKIQQEDYTNSWKQTIDAALEYAKDMQKQFDEIIAAATEALRKSNADTTGGLNSGGGSSGGGGSGGSSGGSSGSSDHGKKKKPAPSSKDNSDVDVISGAAPKAPSAIEIKANKDKQKKKKESSRGNSKNKISKYATGGYVDYTGLAWVDGTPSKPETFLSAADTNLLSNFLKAAHSLTFGLSSSSVRSNVSGTPTVNVDTVEINITQAELKDDADLNKLSQDLSQKFLMDIARQSGNISISRR
jgi:TP901 family phage tail tape measure protein